MHRGGLPLCLEDGPAGGSRAMHRTGEAGPYLGLYILIMVQMSVAMLHCSPGPALIDDYNPD